MPFIITDPCIETKDTACVDVCPVDCIHPRKDEPEFAEMSMLYIHPEECIDCGACVPACPVAAVYESVDATPAVQKPKPLPPHPIRPVPSRLSPRMRRGARYSSPAIRTDPSRLTI